MFSGDQVYNVFAALLSNISPPAEPQLHLPRIKPVAGLTFNHSPQLLQLVDHLGDRLRPQHQPIVEEVMQRLLETGLVQFAAPILVLFHVVIAVSLIHLHAAQPDTQRAGRAGRALGHLLGSFLGGRIVAMLSGAHLQVENARMTELVCDVF